MLAEFLLCVLVVVDSQSSTLMSPSFNPIADTSVNQNAPKKSIVLTGITTGDAILSSLQFTALSDNKTLIPDSALNISYIPGYSTAVLDFKPAANVFGSVKISVTFFGQNSGQILLFGDTFIVQILRTDVDCAYSQWTGYSACSFNCNGGTQTRTRFVASLPTGNGAPCDPNQQTQTTSCNTQACIPPSFTVPTTLTFPENAGTFIIDITDIAANDNSQTISLQAMSDDSNLIPSLSLIYPSSSSYAKLILEPAYGQFGEANLIITATASGTNGPRSSYVTRQNYTVSITPSAVDCKTEMGPWTPCSVTCGQGTRTRGAIVVVPPNNIGQACPSPLPMETQICSSSPCPVDCQTSWGAFQPCSATCGAGTQTRYMVIKQLAQDGGRECPPLTTQTQSCNVQDCPVDCVTIWGMWSDCSVTCGNGVQTRTQEVLVPASNGGARCISPLATQSQSCALAACPAPGDCITTAWTQWSVCAPVASKSFACEHSRNRAILSQATSSKGAPCGSLHQSESCTGELCPAFGTLNSCQGKCGLSQATGCNCDSACTKWGDCCSDYARTCSVPQNVLTMG